MRKIIIRILFFIIIAYFGIGFYVYGESVAVPCAVVEYFDSWVDSTNYTLNNAN